MKQTFLIVLLAVSCAAWVDVATASTACVRRRSGARVAPPPHVVTFVETHCVACHNDRARTGGLSLSADTFASLAGKTETVGEGPSQDSHRPDAAGQPAASEARAETNAVTTWLQTRSTRAADRDPQPGRVGAHRLNRTEYTNAIRDLLVAGDRRGRAAASG